MLSNGTQKSMHHQSHAALCAALVAAGLLAAVEAEFDATAAKKDLTRMGEEPRLRVARCDFGWLAVL
jgi:hypothetical protein